MFFTSLNTIVYFIVNTFGGKRDLMKKNIIFLFFFIISNTITIYSEVYQLYYPNYRVGFFSAFFVVLGALDFYEKNPDECSGLIVDFEDQGLYYDPHHGKNYWQYYFEPIILGALDNTVSKKRFPLSTQSSFAIFALYEMSYERGNELIQKYIKIKPHIQRKINQFVNEHFKENYVIGVHYRGTDKIIEAPHVSYEVVVKYIKEEIKKNNNAKIFVATDEENFLRFMHSNFPGKIIAIDTLRSTNGQPIHFSFTHAYKNGEDALIDCVLLSKCSKLYRTSSNLSAASMRFNPALDVTLLSKNIHEMLLEKSGYRIR